MDDGQEDSLNLRTRRMSPKIRGLRDQSKFGPTYLMCYLSEQNSEKGGMSCLHIAFLQKALAKDVTFDTGWVSNLSFADNCPASVFQYRSRLASESICAVLLSCKYYMHVAASPENCFLVAP